MRRRTQELTGATPMGDPRIPYDQTDPLQQMGVPPQAGGPQASAMPGPGSLPPGLDPQGQAQPPGGTPPASILAGMGGGGGAPLGGGLPQAGGAGAGGVGTDALTGTDLAALSQPVQGLSSPDDQQVAQMEALLNDPNTPPDQLNQVQQLLDLAARRRLAGSGGGGGLGV